LAIIDRGKVLACDAPAKLKRSVARDATFTILTTPCPCISEIGRIPGVKGFSNRTDGSNEEVRFVLEEESVIADIVSFLTSRQSKIISLTKTEPTLEDVFIQLVGRGLE
jgi:ABC-2 type transport system ATP-binding protein